MSKLFGFKRIGNKVDHALLRSVIHTLMGELATNTNTIAISYISNDSVTVYKTAAPSSAVCLTYPKTAKTVTGYLGNGTSLDTAYPHKQDALLNFSWGATCDKPSVQAALQKVVSVIDTLDVASLRQLMFAVDGSYTVTLLDEDDALWFANKGDVSVMCVSCKELGLMLYAESFDTLHTVINKYPNLTSYNWIAEVCTPNTVTCIDRRGHVRVYPIY